MSEKNGVNVLIIGAGLYSCGKGTFEFGTILPACFEAYKRGLVASLYLATHHAESIRVFQEKYTSLCDATGLKPPYTEPVRRDDPKAYVNAIENLADPGAVIVSTPDDLHFSVIMKALEFNKHVLTVKPLTPTIKEGKELVKEAESRKLHNAVDYHKRFDLANLQLINRFREGQLGEPLFFHVEFSQQKWIPEKAFRSWVTTTNVFQYLGVHYVDMIYFITGALPKRAAALGQKGYLEAKGLQADDSIEAIVEWAMPNSNRTFASTFLINWVDPENTTAISYQSIKMVGTKGRFESDQKDRGIEVVTDNEGIKNPNPYFCQPYKDYSSGKTEWRGYGIESVVQFLEDSLAVASHTKVASDFANSRSTFRQALVATSVSEAVNKSLSEKGQWININL